jgi:SAM-dependent methyltransferase
VSGGLSRQYVKLCDLHDFDDPELLAAIREVEPGRAPERTAERKAWEIGMLALFLRDVRALREDSSVLAVGAGTEPPLYWLANRVGRVVATDIYGKGRFAEREAVASMLDDPGAFAPYPYRDDRLEVRWMDARELGFSDGTFEVVYSLSSIEHFGSPGDVARSAAEMGRVLKPGGHAFVVTECFVRRHPLDTAPVHFAARMLTLGRRARAATPRRRSGALAEVFTPRELVRHIVRPSGLRLMQTLDRTFSRASWENIARYAPGRTELITPSGAFYPHIVLGVSRSAFTSVALALEKPT